MPRDVSRSASFCSRSYIENVPERNRRRRKEDLHDLKSVLHTEYTIEAHEFERYDVCGTSVPTPFRAEL